MDEQTNTATRAYVGPWGLGYRSGRLRDKIENRFPIHFTLGGDREDDFYQIVPTSQNILVYNTLRSAKNGKRGYHLLGHRKSLTYPKTMADWTQKWADAGLPCAVGGWDLQLDDWKTWLAEYQNEATVLPNAWHVAIFARDYSQFNYLITSFLGWLADRGLSIPVIVSEVAGATSSDTKQRGVMSAAAAAVRAGWIEAAAWDADILGAELFTKGGQLHNLSYQFLEELVRTDKVRDLRHGDDTATNQPTDNSQPTRELALR